MKETWAAGPKVLTGLICSVLMIFQPVSGAAASAMGVGASLTPRFASPPPNKLNRDPSLIAVANLTGTGERNGRPLLNGSIVASGDFLNVEGNSALLLSPAPDERLELGPHTSAQLTREGEKVRVTLDRGSVGFRTRGGIEVTLKEHQGVMIESRPDSLTVAQLNFVSGEEALVSIDEGSLELVQSDQSILLGPEQSRLISITDTRLQNEPQEKKDAGEQAGSASQSTPGSIKGTVVGPKLFVVSGANVTLTDPTGNTLTTLTDQQGHFVLTKVPAGTYTLSVVYTGFPRYETHDVVVSSGRESSVYVELSGAEKSNKHNGLIIAVVAGGGAAAAIGALAASSKKGTPTVSPSTP